MIQPKIAFALLLAIAPMLTAQAPNTLTPAEKADLRKWLDSMEAQHPELFADVNARVAQMEADRG